MTFLAHARGRSATGSGERNARRKPLAVQTPPLHNAPPMSPLPLRTAPAGFTLIEMVLAVSILAILITIAAPYFRDVIMNTRLASQSNDVLSSMMLARSEATKRDIRVTVCARQQNTNDKGVKNNVCTEGNQWDNGWLVVLDSDGNGEMDDGTTPLSVVEPLTGSNTIKNNGKGPKGTVVFTPTGINESGLTVFRLCDERGQGRAITVTATGRASVSRIETGCK